MRILVCEFVTGGGMPADEPIPAGLAHEGDLMLRALVDDLLEVPAVEVVVTRDARLAPMPPRVPSITVNGPDEAWALWKELAGTVDAVWPIAPETAGALERLSRLVDAAGCRLLNSRADAVAIAASKAATTATLAAAGIPVVPAWRVEDMNEPPDDGPWVVKPDDGAGCVDTRLLRDYVEWVRWRAASERAGFVVQPFIPGAPASLSMLCRDGQAWLLTVNRQHVVLFGSSFVYRGGVVGGMAASPAFSDLAQGIAGAMPGLFGYVGVDFVATTGGPLVLEVNPRLTTSYIGMRRAAGLNVAAAVLDLLREPPAAPVPLDRPVDRIEPVSFHLEPTAWETTA
ncbi:MAG TPA: ATP-grasp domain-containing protein [Azospirillum sp.]|nr:ATP-grasp domain-containing protein [Azospirillum sp.]